MCDTPWFMVDIVKKVAARLLPKGYTLDVHGFNENRFDIVYPGDQFWVAQFFLTPLNGCLCAAIVSHAAWVDSKHRGKGLGRALLQIRTESIKESGFGIALATVRSDNVVERKLLYQAGWRRLTTFPTSGPMVVPNFALDYNVQLWAYHPKGKGRGN